VQAEAVNHAEKAAVSVPMRKELEEKFARRLTSWFSMGGDPLHVTAECTPGFGRRTMRSLSDKAVSHQGARRGEPRIDWRLFVTDAKPCGLWPAFKVHWSHFPGRPAFATNPFLLVILPPRDAGGSVDSFALGVMLPTGLLPIAQSSKDNRHLCGLTPCCPLGIDNHVPQFHHSGGSIFKI
jgi:hypothetical protein